MTVAELVLVKVPVGLPALCKVNADALSVAAPVNVRTTRLLETLMLAIRGG